MSHTIIRPRRTAEAPLSPRPDVDPLSSLDAWVAEGLISSDQAARIRARERTPGTTPDSSRLPLALEASGYVGGVLVLVAVLLLGFEFWDALSRSVRLALLATASLTLIGGGPAVPARAGAAGARLRAALWLAGVGAVAGLLTLVATDVLDLPPDHTAVVTSSGAALTAVVLWRLRPSPVQLLAAIAGTMVAAALAAADASADDALPGLAAWLVAAAWAALAWGGLLPHRRWGRALAAAGMIVAALTMVPDDGGLLLALLTTAAVLVAGVLVRDVALLVVGAMGALNVLPAAITSWFPDSLAAPFALLAIGAGMVGATLRIARRDRPPGLAPRHDWSSVPPLAAGALAGALVATAIVVVTWAAVS